MKFPKASYFILFCTLCEMFFLHSISASLSLYCVDILKFNQNTATVLYHTFKMLGFFVPLIGGIMADSWFGKYRTILYFNFSSIIGGLLLVLSSIPIVNLPTREFSIIGLILVAIGMGGIKPTVATFGGDQFKMPEQKALVAVYYAFFSVALDSGVLLSALVAPILRKDIKCFDKNSCYSLAHFVAVILMIISFAIFFSGRRLYKINRPKYNIFLAFIKCISYAMFRKIISKKNKEHWLDHAEDLYGKRTIKDIKIALNVLTLIIPIPVYFALHDQIGSRWIFQSTRMDGEVFGYLIKPDQLLLAKTLFLIIMTPFFQICVYPVIEKYLFINTPLRKIGVGGIIAGIAFIASGIVEIYLEPTYVVQPSHGLAQIRIFNTLDCNATIDIDGQKFILEGLGMYENISIPVKGNVSLKFEAEFNHCRYIDYDPSLIISENLNVQENKATSLALTKNGIGLSYSDFIKKSKSGDPLVRALIHVDTNVTKYTLRLKGPKMSYSINVKKELNFTNFIEVDPNHYQILINEIMIEENVSIRYGGVYTIVGHISEKSKVLRLVTVVNPNSIHLFWQLPQYILLNIAQIMLQIASLSFVFTQSPLSMKTLLFAAWLFTCAIGNLIIIVIAKAQFFKRPVFESYLYAVLMFIDMLIFARLSRSYKYIEVSSDESVSEILNDETQQKT